MRKSYFGILFLLAFIFAFAPKAFADTSCQPIYGGGQTCITTGNISINKTVMNPKNGDMVDGLSINDARYQPGYITTFRISITNTGNSNISRISIKDVFPQYIAYSSGAGNFDTNTNTLTFEISNLGINETRSFIITGKIVDASQIPITQGSVVCVVNQATATNLDNNSQVSQDNAQLCIEKNVPTTTLVQTKGGFPVLPTVPVTSTPKTGPESLVLLMLTLGGIIGLILRKQAIRKAGLN